MSVFSTNQARNLYVATAKVDDVTAASAVGSIEVGVDNNKTHLYFKHMGKGGITRSDLIDVKNILSVTKTAAAKMATPLKAVKVEVDGEIVAGQDYILKIAFRQFAGMSDEDIYTKFGMAHGKSGMTAAEFYRDLAISLAKNFSKEATELVKFFVATAEGKTEVTSASKAEDLDGAYTHLLIEEVEQEWTLGIKPQVPVYFDVLVGTITDLNSDEVTWGTVSKATSPGSVNNGKKIADLEYFCMGERADYYRNANWPNNIPTEYLVDATKPYDVLDIHYAYVGSNESVQKSEKTITIVSTDSSVIRDIDTAVKAAL